jgi:hypothetical protein
MDIPSETNDEEVAPIISSWPQTEEQIIATNQQYIDLLNSMLEQLNESTAISDPIQSTLITMSESLATQISEVSIAEPLIPIPIPTETVEESTATATETETSVEIPEDTTVAIPDENHRYFYCADPDPRRFMYHEDDGCWYEQYQNDGSWVSGPAWSEQPIKLIAQSIENINTNNQKLHLWSETQIITTYLDGNNGNGAWYGYQGAFLSIQECIDNDSWGNNE